MSSHYGLQVKWGIDLASEHERYLTEEVFRCLEPQVTLSGASDVVPVESTHPTWGLLAAASVAGTAEQAEGRLAVLQP